MKKKASHLQNKPDEALAAAIAQAEANVRHLEENGQFDTSQHELLARLRAELDNSLEVLDDGTSD